MDLLCFHSSETLRKAIGQHLQELNIEFELYSLLPGNEMRKIINDKKAEIVIMEVTRERLNDFKEISSTVFSIPIIKSIDREIAINLEEIDADYILSDSISGFKEKFMKILIKNEKKLNEFLMKDKIFRNIIYGYGFSWGRTYIVNIEHRGEIIDLIPKFSSKIPIFIAMRENPRKFQGQKNSRVIWITDVIGKDRIKPHNLTILTDNIIKFLEKKQKKIVIMDCLEYLLLYNDFINVIRNVELINSYAMDNDSLVIIIVDNNSYTSKEYSLLKRYSMTWKGV